MRVKIGEDDEVIYYCHFIECTCLKDENGVYDNNPNLMDCYQGKCSALEMEMK